MDIMIDIETLSLAPNATILSIGAVEFDAMCTGHEFYVELDPKQNRHLDPETCLWWAQQSAAFLDKRKATLDAALGQLDDFLVPYGDAGDLRVWANSPIFDLAILRDAYSHYSFGCPWKFFQERDVRTAKAFVHKSDYPEFVGMPHNALDDAKYQVKLVQKFLSETGLTL